MDEIRRTKLKLAHALRSQFNYNQGLEKIDFKLDVLEPALKQIDNKASRGELPQILPFEIDEYSSR